MGLERQSNSGATLLQNSLVVKPNRFLMLKIICMDDEGAPDLVAPIPKPFLLIPIHRTTQFMSAGLSVCLFVPFLKVLAVLVSLGYSFR